jgi:hypothetical protein
MTIVKLPRRTAEIDRARAEPGRQLFRPPWYAEDLTGFYVVKAQEGQEVAYIYYTDDPRRRAIMKLPSRDEARRIAMAIAKLPDIVQKLLPD